MKPIRQLPTFVWRTYRGGKLLRRFHGIESEDDFYPEDWISSFVEAKNKVYTPNEGLTKTENGLLKDAFPTVQPRLLIKFLDSAERLGIQVHPDKAYAMQIFGSPFGKAECWHILDTRDEDACVYLGFQPHVTREVWKDLYERQDVEGMLQAMHRLPVKKGDTVLVTGKTPHAIGAGCFLLELQEPTDYTMRVERVTSSGVLTDHQMHYGAGDDALLDCFDYTPRTREEIQDLFFLKGRPEGDTIHRVTFDDTPCFALDEVADTTDYCCDTETTVIALREGFINGMPMKQGDKFFVPANCPVTVSACLICYPPES